MCLHNENNKQAARSKTVENLLVSSRQADQALIDGLRRTAEGVAFDEIPMPDADMRITFDL